MPCSAWPLPAAALQSTTVNQATFPANTELHAAVLLAAITLGLALI